ncbi:antibiotic biosynthesis monooxygenase family protein [Nocardioides sp. NPDC087217]|uniref:antibiotic biosynthesis monooxygenase family protein n=1 Tax=Nocardioides sp. NPDC087217 TaxID=3364335 RepID=UPI00382DD9B0
MSIAQTPEPPYTAVIFNSLRTPTGEGCAETAARMEELAADQPGYLGIESARDGLGITVSYWTDEQAARSWKTLAGTVVRNRPVAASGTRTTRCASPP